MPVQERVFGDLQAMPAVARARARAVGDAAPWAVPPTCIEGARVDRTGLAGIHVIAARGASRPVAEGDRVYGRVVETRSARLLGLADVGRRAAGRLAPGPAEDAGAAIDAAADLLAREGFSFRDVARTWFFLRDSLDWYGPFKAVRNAAFRRMGLVGPGGDGQIPASTGIAGCNARGGWCALDLHAVQPRPGGRVETRRLHNRKQNEATEYGSSFARAMEVTLGDARYLFVSGTASIDDHGATVHGGDFEAQVRHTLEAVEALLDGAGATLAEVAQATRSSRILATDPHSGGSSSDRRCERHPSLRPLPTSAGATCCSRWTPSPSSRFAAGGGREGPRPGGRAGGHLRVVGRDRAAGGVGACWQRLDGEGGPGRRTASIGDIVSVAEGIYREYSWNDDAEMVRYFVNESMVIPDPVIIRTDDFVSIKVENSTMVYGPGKPMLPVLSKCFMCPLGTSILDVNVDCTTNHYALSAKIYPCQAPIVTTVFDHVNRAEIICDEMVYGSDRYYPEDAVTISKGAGVDSCEHVLFLTIRIASQSNPVTNIISIPKFIDIAVCYSPPKQLLCNADEYDMLIIAPDLFIDTLLPLVDHKQSVGIRTTVRTTAEIYSSYDGRDDAERIKYFIKNDD